MTDARRPPSGVLDAARDLEECSMSLTASVRQSGGVTIIDLDGRVTLGDATGLLRETVQREADKNPQIILNLAKVSYMDSAGLGEMIGAHASVTRRNGRIKLLNVQKRLQDLLQITRLYTLFETYEDEATAVASFGTAAGAS
jgi:anti-sigma B factor antagonist